MNFIGKITDIKMPTENSVSLTITTDNTSILEEIQKYQQNQKDMAVEIKRLYNRRTNDANAYFHFLVNKLARHFNISDTEMKIREYP